MEEKKDDRSEKIGAPDSKWRRLPFDATTNFSLLGWFLDKLKKRPDSKENVDLTLED
ncbi:MAG: hypothetical protein ACYS0I_12845 [Planctomycetota bacterium]|jgi:hypothetical protein